MNRIFEALNYIIQALVEVPQKISVERIETPKTDIFTISVAPEEMGRLVGRNGRTAESIRDVLGAIGAPMGKEVILDVIEARAAPPRPQAQSARASRRRTRSKRRRSNPHAD
ncbi:MAG: KH domain-containing protein [Candidatus Bipolaricaulota bacterium]|nr:KH domain-containing protein [Candidatus Bipolaricaulota bacterium]